MSVLSKRIENVEVARKAAIKEQKAREIAVAESAANQAKIARITAQLSIFHPDFQKDISIEKCSELAGKVIRKYAQACYDDGKYISKTPEFCNQKKGAHTDQSWAATYDKNGKSIWICLTCKSIYPRKEKA